jgi:hypothetical protein
MERGGRVPVELGVAAAEVAFRMALRRPVALLEASHSELTDRLVELICEVYTRYLSSPLDSEEVLSKQEMTRRLLAANAFFLGVAVLESLYRIDTVARWIVGALDEEELSA